MRYNSEIFESPYFVLEPNNWHLKPDAPEDLKKKFEEFIAKHDKAHSEEQPQGMTVQEAIEILKANWWKNNLTLKHENFEIIIGKTKEKEPNDKYFPNCYLIDTAIVKKGQKPKQEDWGEMFVSKTDGKCGFAVIIN